MTEQKHKIPNQSTGNITTSKKQMSNTFLNSKLISSPLEKNTENSSIYQKTQTEEESTKLKLIPLPDKEEQES